MTYLSNKDIVPKRASGRKTIAETRDDEINTTLSHGKCFVNTSVDVRVIFRFIIRTEVSQSHLLREEFTKQAGSLVSLECG